MELKNTPIFIKVVTQPDVNFSMQPKKAHFPTILESRPYIVGPFETPEFRKALYISLTALTPDTLVFAEISKIVASINIPDSNYKGG